MKNAFVILMLFVLGGITTKADRPLPQGYLSIPVLITLSDGSSGSGFFLNGSNHLFLATARHVLFGKNGFINATNATLLANPDNPTNREHFEIQIDLAALQAIGEVRTNATHDVAVIRLAATSAKGGFDFSLKTTKIINPLPTGFVAVSLSWLTRLDQVEPGGEIFVFGYPSSVGLQQSPKFDYSKPLLRKGIISGIYQNAKTIVIDSSVYFGNSGGPVVQVEHVSPFETRYNVVGIVSEMIPFIDVWESKRFGYSNLNVSNSGYSVVEPVDFIIELLWD